MVSKQTVTLANSIVGVSVLAMPFCFKQCGIILATLMLILAAVITRTVCYFLLKAGTITRRRTYEMLAWHTFGQGGKFIVEISIIGFLIGTLIAFFVVMGDLGPVIVSEVFDIENNYSLRNIILAALSLFVALPLGLLRNVDSLSSVSKASVLFYVFLVFKILSEGLGPLFSGSYLDRIDYWRPAGVLQCIPILSMALSCQTQIFGIYESLPEPSVQKMNEIVKQAVTICTAFYFCIGFLGYIAFCNQSFGGNILMSFSSSWTTQLIKLCFLMSIVFSVPLIVFPCRASLNSLIFRREHMHHSLHDISTNYIPDGRLKFLTIIIIGFTLVVGIIIPNIELVLGLVGSTTGTVICIIFPSIIFIRVTSKQTTERLLAQVIFVTGIIMMVVSTYATLYAVEQAQVQSNDPLPDQIRIAEIIKESAHDEIKASFHTPDSKIVEMSGDLKHKLDDLNKLKKEQDKKPSSELPISSPKNAAYQEINNNNRVEVHPNTKEKNKEQNRVSEGKDENKLKDDILLPLSLSTKFHEKNDIKVQPPIPIEPIVPQQQEKVASQSIRDGPVDNQEIQLNTHNVEVNDKVKDMKETPSGLGQIPNAVDQSPALEKDSAVEILKKLEVHQENQKKLLEEQSKILEELKEHHEQDIHRQQQSDAKDNKAPFVADKLINAVAGESKKEEQIDQDVIDKKVEVLQQEKLIEKFSENIEKEKENVKIIEKIEAGLNKEIVKIESEPKLNDKVKMPVPIPVENNPQLPIVVGERIGQLVKTIPVSPSPSIPDPTIKVANVVKSDPDPSIPVFKPMPIETLKKSVEMPKIQQNVELDDSKKLIKQGTHDGSKTGDRIPPNLKEHETHQKVQIKETQLDRKPSVKASLQNSDIISKSPKVSEPRKPVDRDI